MIIKTLGYSIILGQLVISQISNHINFKNYSKIVLLTEEKIYKLWWKEIEQYFPKNIKIIQIQSGEKIKNIQTAIKIWQKMIDLNIDRKSLLINFGGGMISDLGGFVASTYMRGIDFINIPTTLLAAVDASIGGKVAVNLKNTKNIIGVFNNPKLVLIDVNFFETLGQRELVSASAEIIKHGIIVDKNYFELVKNGINFEDKNLLIEIIKRSLEIKRDIVEKDFKEQNIRKLLNFGHTIGHAFETASLKTNRPLLHGEAVVVGMIIESAIARKIGMLSNEDEKRIKECIMNCGFKKLLEKNFNYDIQELLTFVIRDKKNDNGKIRFVLPREIGRCEYDIEIEPNVIRLYLEEFLH